jgi:MFS transporter, DHA1 family, tetracycline resistance protein
MERPPAKPNAVTDTSGPVQRWYLSYALLGLVISGVAPIVLPLLAERTGGPTAPGLVMAAFNLGMLAAPLWGALADRTGWHRPLYASGLAVLAAGIGAFPLRHELGWFVLTALVIGLAASVTATVANLFITERHPRASWGARFGWLQTFYGAGQVAGLVMAGAFGGSHATLALGFAALAAVLAAAMFRIVPMSTPTERPVAGDHHARHGGLVLGTMMSHAHLPHLMQALAKLPRLVRSGRSPFLDFLGSWFLGNVGSAAVFSFYPLVMGRVFGLQTGAASWAFAGAAAVGLLLYGPAGSASKRLGPRAVYRTGLALRLAALVFLTLVGLTHVAVQGWLAVVGFGLVVLAWSLLAVSGSDLAAESSSLPQGEAMGLYAASGAVAAVIGSLLGGFVAALTGYAGLLWVATAFVLAALALMRRRQARPTTDGAAPAGRSH